MRINSYQFSLPRWYFLYFVLACFDLLTISYSLYSNQKIMALYTKAIHENEEWSKRLNLYSELTQLATEVNAPGNDVFGSQAIENEYQRFKIALTVFEKSYNKAAEELQKLGGVKIDPLRTVLHQVNKIMQEMCKESETLFNYLRHENRDLAGEHMALMDQKNFELLTTFAHLNRQVREIQNTIYDEQRKVAQSLKSDETIITIAIGIMVIGVTIYGHKLAKTMQQTQHELKSLNENLEQRVTERTEEATQLVVKLRALSTQLMLSEEQERQRLAADLHDDLGQKIALTKIKLSCLQATEVALNPQQSQLFQDISQLVGQVEKQIRSLTFQLSPPILDQLGLVPALEWLSEDMKQHYQLDIRLHAENDPIRLSQQIRIILFRSIRELCINVARHAHTHNVNITIDWLPNSIALTIEDNGKGFTITPDARLPGKYGFGLFSIRERIENLDGTFQINSAPDQGTRIYLRVPFDDNKTNQTTE